MRGEQLVVENKEPEQEPDCRNAAAVGRKIAAPTGRITSRYCSTMMEESIWRRRRSRRRNNNKKRGQGEKVPSVNLKSDDNVMCRSLQKRLSLTERSLFAAWQAKQAQAKAGKGTS